LKFVTALYKKFSYHSPGFSFLLLIAGKAGDGNCGVFKKARGIIIVRMFLRDNFFHDQ
jgi:hypothetical protein